MATFTDVLADLNRQGFGSGLAQYGKALADKRENETLVEGINSFNEKKKMFEGEELKTTVEQLADAQSIPKGEKDLTTKLAEASSNMYKVYDKMGAYQNLYQPFITAFATLGEDGIRVANTLSNQLGSEIDMLEKKAGIPMKALEFEVAKQEWEMNDIKIDEINREVQHNKDIAKVADYLMDNPLMDNIPGGEVTSYVRSDWIKYGASKKALMEDARQHFKDLGLSDDVLGKAFQLSQSYLGNQFHFINKPEMKASVDMSGGYNDMRLQTDKWLMQQLTGKWNGVDSTTRKNLQKYMTAPEGEKQQFLPDNADERKLFLELVPLFDAGGAYMQAYGRVKGYYSSKGIDWDHIKKENKDGFGVVTYVDMDKDMIRPYGPMAFGHEKFTYNPATTSRFKKYLDTSLQKIESEMNAFKSGDTVYDDIDKMINSYQFVPPQIGMFGLTQSYESQGKKISKEDSKKLEEARKKLIEEQKALGQ